MYVLGISSATKMIGVSLINEGEVLAEYSTQAGATEELIVYIDKVLKKANIPLKRISGIAVTTGPGSYGGLRGGLAGAKTLSQVSGISIVGVSTLQAIAYNLIDVEGAIFAALDACREDFNLALFTVRGQNLTRLTEDMVLNIDKIVGTLRKIKGKAYLVCPHSGLPTRVLEMFPNTSITILPVGRSWPFATNVAMIGLEKLKKKETDDFIALAPHYSHKPNIREYKGPSKAEI